MFERLQAYNINGRIRLQEAKILQDQIKQLGAITESNYVTEDRDEADYMALGSEPHKLDPQDRQTLLEQVNKIYFKSGHGRNIIRLFEKYVVGRSFGIEPTSQTPAVKEYWQEFWKLNKMDLRKKEIVRRGIRDGEAFLRYFEESKQLKVRFMNPARMANPDDKNIEHVSGGVETDKDDIEEVVNYYYKNTAVPAAEVQHIKILVDSDETRGRSYLEPLLEDLAMYKKWLKDRMKLNEVRAIVGLIKKVKGTPTQAANVATKYETSRKTNADGTTLSKAPKNVSVFTTNQNVDYELKSANLQASDAQHDGRSLLLDIAAGSGLPEFMVSSDSSNSNYASTMVAEGPAIKEFEDWQDFFAYHFRIMYERVIAFGIKSKKIPDSEIVTEEQINPKTKEIEEIEVRKPTSTECSITFPDLISRDIEKETKAYVLQRREGIMSLQTMSARLDLNFDEEQRLIQQSEEGEEEEAPEEEEERIRKEEEEMAEEE